MTFDQLHRQTGPNAGADGIFIPCIIEKSDIQTVVMKSSLPVNVMCMPGLPDFKSLQRLGVKRISMGNFLFDSMLENFENTLNSILYNQSFESVFQ